MTITISKYKRKCNNLSGKEWLQNSISIWSNLKKAQDENNRDHPASFPRALVRRLLDCFTNDCDKVVLDPFVGAGTTIVEALSQGKFGIGVDVYGAFLEKSETRLNQTNLFNNKTSSYRLIHDSAINLRKYLDDDSVDIIITSPPYWDILNQKRTADGKEIKTYGNNQEDLGTIKEYSVFLTALSKIFGEISLILKKDKYCIINVMDVRKGPVLYTIHSDLTNFLANYGYELDDLIIWDRSHEYNNLRPLGYPTVFRINRIHEYLLVFRNRRL